MATDVSDGASCRALLLFALQREADPLMVRPELPPIWLDQFQVYAFVQRRVTDPYALVQPTAEDVIVEITGVGAIKAEDTLNCILKHFPRPGLVIAAGYCGALRGGLAVGDVVVPSEVVDEFDRSWTCKALPGLPSSGRLLTSSRIIGDPVEKAETHLQFDADIVDMESAAIAALCEERGLPFAAVRVVSDASDTALSPELERLLSGGNVSVWKALRALVRKPSMWREFLRLGRDTKLAARNLAEALVKVIGPGARRASKG